MTIISKISSFNNSLFGPHKNKYVETGNIFVNTVLKRDSDLYNYIDGITDIRRISCCFQSSFSFVCIDDSKQFVFKVFNICNQNITKHYQTEKENYESLKRRGVLKNGFYHSNYENKASKYYVMTFNYMGEDALEMINQERMTELAWLRNIWFVPTFIDKCHEKGIYHMDIKLENMCYNGEKWTLIDWGLSKFDKIPISRINGTLPYIHPSFASKNFQKEFQTVGYEVCDYYSYALSLFSVYMYVMSGCCENCFQNKLPCHVCKDLGTDETAFIKIRICDIYDLIKTDDVRKVTWLYKNDNIINKTIMLKVMQLLGKIVLSELDRTKRYLVWDREYNIRYVGNYKTDPEIENQFKTCNDHWKEFVQDVEVNN